MWELANSIQWSDSPRNFEGLKVQETAHSLTTQEILISQTTGRERLIRTRLIRSST